MSSVAAFVGTPPTAGVGCSAKARSIAVVEMLRSRPVIAVHRCQTAAVRFNWGWAGIVRSSHSGSRATRIVSTTNWCSCRFLAELASAAALAASSLGSAARGAEPANGLHMTRLPDRATRSSGLAPTRAAPVSSCPQR